MTSHTLQTAALMIFILILALLLGQGLKKELNKAVTTKQKIVKVSL
jgi:hypothetical protein